jgi:hypothetical protein
MSRRTAEDSECWKGLKNRQGSRSGAENPVTKKAAVAGRETAVAATAAWQMA